MKENTKEWIRQQATSHLKKAKKTGYVCPICGSGTGENGTGITTKDQIHFTCWKGCFKHADIIDIIGLEYGLKDDNSKFEKAAEIFNISEEKEYRPAPAKKPKEAPLEDYSDYFRQAAQHNDYRYLKERGISEKTQQRFFIGLDTEWKSPTALLNGKTPPASARCIIPTSKYSYIARATDPGDTIPKMKEGKTALFNLKALDNDIVFITEGEIDAMSIETLGEYSAIGLGSVSMTGKLLEAAKDKDCYFILFLDNDEAGRKATAQLEADLKALGKRVIVGSYDGKDPNEALIEDRKGFYLKVDAYLAKAQSEIIPIDEQCWFDIEGRIERGNIKDAGSNGNEYRASDLLDYFRNIEQAPESYEASTGFEHLDRNLEGGLHEGLYIIGAISSLGKTTFSLQLADQIAGSGKDVLFFSLEMSKEEIMAKSISRHTFKNNGYEGITKTTQQIMNSRRYKGYNAAEKAAIANAINTYSLQARNLYLYDNAKRLTAKDIQEIVEKHIADTGRKPVVFVDYLQIIAPEDIRSTDKQATDTNVFRLKELSKKHKIPVFAISSFNRENYTEPVSMTSFKESGAVEYSSDVLLGLQYKGMEYQEREKGDDRKKRIRDLQAEVERLQKEKKPIEVELKCLKNRNGYKFTMPFRMIAAYNTFEELEGFVSCEPQRNPFLSGKPSRVI